MNEYLTSLISPKTANFRSFLSNSQKPEGLASIEYNYYNIITQFKISELFYYCNCKSELSVSRELYRYFSTIWSRPFLSSFVFTRSSSIKVRSI